MKFGWLKFVLILAIQSRGFSVAVDQSEYEWAADVLQIARNFSFASGRLSTANRPVPSSNVSDTASFPRDDANQNTNFKHRAVPHILRVRIRDRIGKISSVAMRSLIISGNVPHVKVLYPSPPGGSLDGGENQLKIHGMIYNLGNVESEYPSLVYPLPINEKINYINIELPAAAFGSFSIPRIRMKVNVIDFMETTNCESTEVPIVERQSWQPEMLAKQKVMSFFINDDIFLTSTDHFLSSHAQKVTTNESEELCPTVFGATITLRKQILHLRKAGPALSRQFSSKQWELLEDSVTFDGNRVSCLTRASTSPKSYYQELLVASSQNNLYFASDLEASRLHLKELFAAGEVSVCEAVSMEKSSCIVLDHAFDPSSCCKIFVLLQNTSDSSCILLEYTDISQRGKWNVLAVISNRLPALGENRDKIIFLDQENEYTGRQFKINGLSTLTYPDGTVYIWGDVLLVYDIRSGVLAWIPSFLPSSTLTNSDAAIQFATASERGIYSILTQRGSVWIGSAYPFEKHYSQLLQLVLPAASSDYITIFFDPLDKLYGLKYVTNSSSYSIKRDEIALADTISSTENSIVLNCPRLFLRCNAENSAFHINHTTFSRTRHFSIRPPQLLPKGQEGNLPYFVHPTKSLFTYLTAMERFFVGERIGEDKWWFSGANNDEFGEWWYTKDSQLNEYRKYLSVGSLLPNDPIVYLSKKQFHHETIVQPRKHSNWDSSYCALPPIIYLDRNQEFRFMIYLEQSLSSTRFDSQILRLVAISSDNTVLNATTLRKTSFQFHTIFEVIITGQQMPHRPPGYRLTTVSVAFYPWNPPSSVPNLASTCCSGTSMGTAFEQNMLVKVGCPPARRLRFDMQRSLDILYDRGRTDDFECLYDAQNSIPCFTTSEFAAAFYVEDLVTGEKSPFRGNYTLQVIAGGTGYLENVKKYSDDEIMSYNYRPGDSKTLLSLIWTVLLESSSKGMQDGKTGQLIFDAKNPASIVFECRLNSPCGNIPFGTSNPGEFYLEIEVSNKGVDSSTNCDYTMTFMIHLIGIELSPRVHLVLMLVTLSFIVAFILLYYVCKFHDGYHMMRRYFKKETANSDSDSASEFTEPAQQFHQIMNRRLPTSGITNTASQSSGVRRPSLLAHSLIQDTERVKNRSSLRVHTDHNAKSNTSHSDT